MPGCLLLNIDDAQWSGIITVFVEFNAHRMNVIHEFPHTRARPGAFPAQREQTAVEPADVHPTQECNAEAFEVLMHQKAADAGGSKRQAETLSAGQISRLPFDT
jgi:hypothetical protein